MSVGDKIWVGQLGKKLHLDEDCHELALVRRHTKDSKIIVRK